MSVKTVSARIFLVLFILAFVNPSSLLAATEQRIALVIGNGAYGSGPLKNPVNDAADMAKALQETGFKVTLKQNANLQEMIESIENFGNSLKRGGVGLFFYAGHGVQVSGVNYLLPVNVRIKKESDVRFQAVDVGRVLAEMENANNGLNIVILDACRDNPFGKSFRSASRGLAIVANAPTGTFISYSTGAGQVAGDGDGRNSPYTQALLENMTRPGLSINELFIKVRGKVKKETGQVPWELSSLEGNFFFVPGGPERRDAALTDEPAGPAAARNAFQDENRKLEEERGKPAKERELPENRTARPEDRIRLLREQARLGTSPPAGNVGKPDIEQLQGVWKDGNSRSRNMRITVANNEITIHCWDTQDNEVTQISDLSWADNALKMVMYTPSTGYRNNVVLRLAGPNELKGTITGSWNGKATWTRLSF